MMVLITTQSLFRGDVTAAHKKCTIFMKTYQGKVGGL